MAMLALSLVMSAALTAARFGPANIVEVQKTGADVRITAFGDMHLVRIDATNTELQSCQEKIREAGRSRTCDFAQGGKIELSPCPAGTKVVIADAADRNVVDFVLDAPGLAHAATALTP